MSIMRSTGSPDRGNNPAERGENHIDDGAQHENMEGAEPITEPAENHAESAIAEAENEPSDKTRRQEIPRQMRTDQHEVLGSQDASNRLTRIYGDGCATSTTTGVPGSLSFPARSTAVAVYQ